ncbi:BTB/POZ domain-containing protein 6-like [Oculina patagonica]
MQVLYLAEKYMIPCLTDKCTEYLAKNLDLSNVFFVLQRAQQYENKNLLCHCWNLIDKKTEEVLKSNEFQSMDRSFLRQLVERNTLSIREVKLFKAVDCWAEEECKRQQLKADGSVKRQILGEEIVKNVRFPIMKQEELRDVVLPSKILSQEEAREVMKYFFSHRTPTGAFNFLEGHRLGSLLRCCRFESVAPHGTIIDYEDDEGDWFFLKVDKDILLHGVSLLGNDGSTFTVTLEVRRFDDDDDDDDYEDGIVVLSQTGTFTSRRKECSNGYYYGFDVIFDESFAVKKNILYSIHISVDGPGYYPVISRIDAVNFSGVEFLFDNITDGVVNQSLCVELIFQLVNDAECGTRII